MKIKSLSKIKNLKNKKVLLRVDFNIPQTAKRLGDDYRLRAALPTINYLLDRGAAVILISHWGDPVRPEKQLSTQRLAKLLQKISNLKVKFVPDIVGDKTQQAATSLQSGEIIFLENLRFHAGEKKNETAFAKKLAALADYYVNDAFSVCHRAQASVSAITKYLPAFAGLQLEQELLNLERIIKPKKPLVLVMGGAKISTKAPIIKKLYKTANQILIGGGIANSFLKKQGLEIGRSLYDQESLKKLSVFLKGKNVLDKIVLPVDVVVKDNRGYCRSRDVKEVKKSDAILDVGPQTISLFSAYIKKAQTIAWNGPLGKFEEAAYKHGTLAIAAIIAARSTGLAFGVVGGGETVAALKLTQMQGHVDWVSTGGGAMLSYLGGEKMPGLKNIIS